MLYSQIISITKFTLIYKIIFSIPFIWRLITFIGYLFAIVGASLTSPNRIPKIIIIPHIDKIVHFVMYFGFCVLASWSFDKRKYSFKTKNTTLGSGIFYVTVLFLAISWGFIMELFQRYMAVGRQYSMNDMIANASGALSGILIYYVFFGKLENVEPLQTNK